MFDLVYNNQVITLSNHKELINVMCLPLFNHIEYMDFDSIRRWVYKIAVVLGDYAVLMKDKRAGRRAERYKNSIAKIKSRESIINFFTEMLMYSEGLTLLSGYNYAIAGVHQGRKKTKLLFKYNAEKKSIREIR